MAVNQQRGLLNVVSTLNNTGRVSGDSGAGSISTGRSQVFETAASGLAQIGDEIGKIADHAAAVEGERAGKLAGLDPEFRPTRSMTIRGEAYDRAGLQVYETTAKLEIENELSKAAAAAGDNPGAYLDKTTKLRGAWLSKIPDELKPDVVHMFRRSELSFMRGAARAQAERVSAEQRGAVQSSIENGIKGLHQRAYQLGLDDKADAAIAGDLAELQGVLSRTDINGKPIVAPAQAAKILGQAKEETTNARLMGAFSRLPSLEAKQAFIDKIGDDWQQSKGLAKIYDLDGFERITGKLRADLSRDAAGRNAAVRAIAEDVRDVERLTEKGYAPPAEDLAALRARVATSGDETTRAQLEQAENLANWQSSARVATPAELDGFVAAAREQLTAPGLSIDQRQVAVRRVELAEKMATEMRSELKKDPLGWADRVQLLKVVPLDFSSADTAAVSVKARVAQAEEVATRYGQAPIYLRPNESRALATAAAQGGAQTLDIASTIASAGGERAPAILAEVADHAPVVAMLGGHVASAGRTPLAQDAADGIALQKTDGFKGEAPSADVARREAIAATSGALATMPKTEQAVIAVANAAYEVRARRKGLTDFDGALYQQVVREALGETTVGGDRYGGVVERGGWFSSAPAVIIPPNVRQSGFDDLVDAIKIEDLTAAFGVPLHGDDRPATPAAIKRARLVQAGDSKYLLALGDDEDPQYLKTGRDEPYVLDLKALEPVLRKRRPDLYLGGP